MRIALRLTAQFLSSRAPTLPQARFLPATHRLEPIEYLVLPEMDPPGQLAHFRPAPPLTPHHSPRRQTRSLQTKTRLARLLPLAHPPFFAIIMDITHTGLNSPQ